MHQAETRGLASLGPDGLERLCVLYRAAASDLARSRTEGWPQPVQHYLNELVARAHSRIYASRPRSRIGLLSYFFGIIPATFRRRWGYVLVSLLITVAVGAMAYWGVRRDPALAHELLGSMADAIEEFARGDQAAGQYFADQPFVRYLGGGAFSAFLFLHNLKVAVMVFVAGVTFGLLTFYLLVVNALMLGVFFAVGANAGALGKLASVVAPHGALELPAVFLAAGGGLLMAHALVRPGRWRRADALRIAARDALALLAAAAPLFLAAGIIEGNLSPRFRGLFASDPVRFLFSAVVFVVMLAYLVAGDRLLPPSRRPRQHTPPWP